MTKTYSAASLDDIANQFDEMADRAGQRGLNSSILRDKKVYAAEARIWREAAAVLRDTEMKP